MRKKYVLSFIYFLFSVVNGYALDEQIAVLEKKLKDTNALQDSQESQGKQISHCQGFPFPYFFIPL